MKPMKGSSSSGFSLIELLVAMTVTLVVSGAIFMLLTKGQNAFRREPELVDRQQNIRVAMDLIMRDIGNAGAGLPALTQVFTQNLNACAGCPNGGAPMGPDGAGTDELEMVTNAGGFAGEPACNEPGGGSSSQITLLRGATSITPPQSVLVMFCDGSWTVRTVVSTSGNRTASGDCSTSDHVQLNVNPGAGDPFGLNTPAGICQPSANGLGNVGTLTGPLPPGCTDPCTVSQVGSGEVVRYRIRNDANGVPVLQRFSSAGPAGFQNVAQGIEDLQVDYVQANGAVSTGGAPAVAANDLSTLVTEVRVRLSARSEAVNLEGMATAASAKTALRGRLASVGSPRTALLSLTQASPSPLWR